VIFDTDDLYEGHDRMDLLQQLRAANPLFKMTAFAVPALCSDEYIESLPAWIEVVPHGWAHGGPGCPDAHECANWTYERMWELIEEINGRSARWSNGRVIHDREGVTTQWRTSGFKAPGWQISDGCYQALADAHFWVADQHYNDHRRPAGLDVHCEGDGDHVHTHVQNVCGNGLEELFPTLLEKVRAATTFEFVSEAAKERRRMLLREFWRMRAA
jgi:hypothetical protein